MLKVVRWTYIIYVKRRTRCRMNEGLESWECGVSDCVSTPLLENSWIYYTPLRNCAPADILHNILQYILHNILKFDFFYSLAVYMIYCILHCGVLMHANIALCMLPWYHHVKQCNTVWWKHGATLHHWGWYSGAQWWYPGWCRRPLGACPSQYVSAVFLSPLQPSLYNMHRTVVPFCQCRVVPLDELRCKSVTIRQFLISLLCALQLLCRFVKICRPEPL